MNQVVQDKMQREIMVVANEKLFWNCQRENRFYHNDYINFEANILHHYEFMKRWEAEKNFDYKQAIPYGILVNDENKVFVYKRWGRWSNAWEARLHQKISLWLGWHIEKEDETSSNIVLDSLLREIEEEVHIEKKYITSHEAIGYINDDSNEVWKVHLWVCYIVKTSAIEYELLDWELDNGEFMTLENIEKMSQDEAYDLETWSQIVLPFLKDYL